MTVLSEDPDNQELRRLLNINDDILCDDIRQLEVKNWLNYLVIPTKQNGVQPK